MKKGVITLAILFSIILYPAHTDSGSSNNGMVRHIKRTERPTVQRPHKIASRGTQPIILQATAYTWTGNRTASGKWPKVGRTIAVNPKIIPLGSRVYLHGIGERIAEDVIPQKSITKGASVDIFVYSKTDARNFGRRNLRVEVR